MLILPLKGFKTKIEVEIFGWWLDELLAAAV